MNLNTRKAYREDVRDFMEFIGFASMEGFRSLGSNAAKEGVRQNAVKIHPKRHSCSLGDEFERTAVSFPHWNTGK